jgi:hypothetical protein
VRRDIVELPIAVSRGGDDLTIADDRRADRNFATLAGRLSLANCARHKGGRFPFHIASPSALC